MELVNVLTECSRIRRLIASSGGEVRLSYRNYRTHKRSQLSLTPEELVRRFLLHVLPKGFMRIRHYGYLSNAIRRESLEKIRKQTEQQDQQSDQVTGQGEETTSGCHCTACGDKAVHYKGEVSSNQWQRLALNTG